MIKIDLYDIKFQTTLKKASEDGANKEYMTNSCKEVIDFDEVKKAYVQGIKSTDMPTSNDAFICLGEEYYFIEFKNGKMRNAIHNVRRKIYESLLIYSDITGHTISFTREKVNYILVYNSEKNKMEVEHQIKERQKQCNPNLDKREIQESSALDDILRTMGQLAKENLDIWGLEAAFGKMYFNKVKTYDMLEFEEEFIKLYCSDING